MHLVWQVISFAYICFNWVLKATTTKKPDVSKILNTLKYMQSFAENISLKIASIHQAAFSLFSSKFVVII